MKHILKEQIFPSPPKKNTASQGNKGHTIKRRPRIAKGQRFGELTAKPKRYRACLFLISTEDWTHGEYQGLQSRASQGELGNKGWGVCSEKVYSL